MAKPVKAVRATVTWEGDSREILREWPKDIRIDFGTALNALQEGQKARIPIRPMPSIAPSVFELKDADEGKWYRLVYLARIKDVIYVLHCFSKDTAKTERRDLALAEQRWKQVQQRLMEEQKNEKQAQRGKSAPRDTGKRTR
jgi:phage-related protein